MAGTTRFGYSGGGKDGGDEGEAPEGAGALGKATVFGRDAHLLHPRARSAEPVALDPAGSTAPPTPPSSPAEAPAARLPSRSGKSGFPARAGFWGRRNTQGELEPAAAADAQDSDLAAPDRPRRPLPPLAQHAVVVLVSAGLSFLAVLLTLKLREPPPAPVEKPAAGAAAREMPAPVPPSPLPAPPPAAAPRPPATTARPSPPPTKQPRGPRPARRASSPQGPGDRVLPPSFHAP